MTSYQHRRQSWGGGLRRQDFGMGSWESWGLHENIIHLIFFLFIRDTPSNVQKHEMRPLPHQRADDEALTRLLQTFLFLVASPILVKSMFSPSGSPSHCPSRIHPLMYRNMR